MKSKTLALQLSPAANSALDAGPIQCVPIPEALAATMFMPIAVILAVGVDLSLSKRESHVWQNAGYHVTEAGSIRDAIDHIRYGDFDLVLLGDSIRLGDRERLAFLIRGLGSRVPVVCVTDSSGYGAAFADATVHNEPIRLLQCIRELLAVQAGKPAANRATARTDS